MRHQIVTRIVVSLAILWTGAVVLFAWSVTRPVMPTPDAPVVSEEPGNGEALFSSHCGTCHDAAETGQRFRSAANRDAAAVEFRAFLEDHYGPSPEGNALIVSHVMSSGDR